MKVTCKRVHNFNAKTQWVFGSEENIFWKKFLIFPCLVGQKFWKTISQGKEVPEK